MTPSHGMVLPASLASSDIFAVPAYMRWLSGSNSPVVSVPIVAERDGLSRAYGAFKKTRRPSNDTSASAKTAVMITGAVSHN